MRICAGSPRTAVEIDYDFLCIEDFQPARLQLYKMRRGTRSYARNDLAVIRERVRALRRLQSWWHTSTVRVAWEDSKRREKITFSVAQIRECQREARLAVDTISEVVGQLPQPFDHGGEVIELLAALDDPLHVSDSHSQIMRKIQLQTRTLQQLRDVLLRQVFEKIRAIERSYRALTLFLPVSDNATDGTTPSTELCIFNVDAGAIKSEQSKALRAIKGFVEHRNDSLSFRGQVSGVAVPGFLPRWLRENLEEWAVRYGVVLLSDFDDEQSVAVVQKNLRVGGKYEFVRLAAESPSQHILGVGSLELRPDHVFESESTTEGGLYAPASLIALGMMAQLEATNQQIGETLLWAIPGPREHHPELSVGDLDHYRIEQQLVTVVSDPQGKLYLYSCRPAADDSSGILRSFVVRRLCRYLQNVIEYHVMAVARHELSREMLEEFVESPLERLLSLLAREEVIAGYSIVVDKNSQMRSRGVCDVTVKLKMLVFGVYRNVEIHSANAGSVAPSRRSEFDITVVSSPEPINP